MSDNGASSEGGPIGSLNDVRNWNAIGHSIDESFERLDEIGGPRIHNNYPWGWTVAGGVASLILAFMIYAQWPVSGLWVIGMFVAIELLMQGSSMIAIALEARAVAKALS